MKKILLSLVVAMSIISCKEKTETPNETSTENNEVKTEIKDSITEKESEITFENYKIEYEETNVKAKIDFDSNETAKGYKTAISESYKDGKVNFSGYYIVVTWGCGTSCISGAMVDIRDGKVYDLPSDEEWDGIGNSYATNKESSLFVTSISGLPIGNDDEAIEKYWKWNEKSKKFEFIKTMEIKIEKKK